MPGLPTLPAEDGTDGNPDGLEPEEPPEEPHSPEGGHIHGSIPSLPHAGDDTVHGRSLAVLVVLVVKSTD